jgi:hypothetical protein
MACEVLDLAVMSYAGVYCERFDPKFLEDDRSEICLPYMDEIPGALTPLISLRHRRLQCLDIMLKCPVWVFHSYKHKDDCRLLLSTTVEILSDI